MVACESCSSIMKKCVQCRTNITEMVPLSVCSGGQGTISKLQSIHQEEEKKVLEIIGCNNAGHGVAMNNTMTPVVANNNNINAAVVSSGENNTNNAGAAGAAGISGVTTNNLNLVNDVQRLQQQLQDIKEQVS